MINKLEHFKGFSYAIVIFFIVLFGGGYVYAHVEGWNYLDSIYFTAITVTTIGYGDFAPQTPAGKIFTIFFPLIGIAIVFYLFSVFGNYIFKSTFEKNLKEHHNKITEHHARVIKNLTKTPSKRK